MNLLIVEDHEGYGTFPLFTMGTLVNNINHCKESKHWLACEIDGYETFIPETYITNNTLHRDYNPTELIVKKNQIVTLIDIVFEWLYVKDADGIYGWLLANKVISI